MGACLSCLGLSSSDSSSPDERQQLLRNEHSDYQQHGWSIPQQHIPAPANGMSHEDQVREQRAFDHITRWASDQIVEIFPHQPRDMGASNVMSGSAQYEDEDESMEEEREGLRRLKDQEHQDILLSMIPGDKSKRSIRIYPASRPSSREARSVRSQASKERVNGAGKREPSGVFVRLDVDVPR